MSVEPATSSNQRPSELEAVPELVWIRPPDAYEPYCEPETLFERGWKKTKANPVVPIGMLATCAALTVGLYSMQRGNTRLSQLMMRSRVAAQGFTVIALMTGVYLTASKQGRKVEPAPASD